MASSTRELTGTAPFPTTPKQRSNTAFIVTAGILVIALIGGFAVAQTRSTSAVTTTTAAAGQPYAAASIAVGLTDFKVALPATTFSAGMKTLTIVNSSSAMQHELLVFRPDASIDLRALPLDEDGNVDEEALGINKVSDGDNIDPGKAQTRQLDLTQPGTYVFLCNLAGHYKLGMWTIVTVK